MRPSVTGAAMRFPAFIVSLGLLAGCATSQLVFDKPGVTEADRKRDSNECMRAAVGSNGRGRFLGPYGLDREAYAQCMEARGYTIKRQ